MGGCYQCAAKINYLTAPVVPGSLEILERMDATPAVHCVSPHPQSHRVLLFLLMFVNSSEPTRRWVLRDFTEVPYTCNTCGNSSPLRMRHKVFCPTDLTLLLTLWSAHGHRPPRGPSGSRIRKVMTLQKAVKGIQLLLLHYKIGFWKLTAETVVLRAGRKLSVFQSVAFECKKPQA